MSKQPLQVAVVSRHQLTRAGLAHLLTFDVARAVVYDVSSQDGHLGGSDAVVYDLAGLVDTRDNDLTHLLATGTPVVVLEPDGRADLGEGAIAVGAADVVRMDVTAPELLQALERAASGTRTTSEDRRQHAYARLTAEFGLTEGELEILDLIATGVTNEDITTRVYLSINTIKTRIRSAYKKIGISSRSEAVLWAVQRGLGRPRPDEPPTANPI